MRRMPSDPSPLPNLASGSTFRVTLFFGPEPIGPQAEAAVCVFNVKKRSWKAGVQVSVEVDTRQLSTLRARIRLNERLAPAFSAIASHERPEYEARAADLFAQAVSWCKLDLRLQTGLPQENQRLLAHDLVSELDEAVSIRTDYVVTYVLTELDLST